MRALVTGCAGFIGSHLTESLLEDVATVVGVDCFNDNYGRPEKLRNMDRARAWENFEFVPIDLARGQLEDLLEECDVCYHLAAEPGVRSSWGARFDLYLRNNVLATQHLLEAAKRVPDKRFVFASSSSVYGHAESFPTPEDALPRPFSPYGVTKLSAENLCSLYHDNFGVDAVTLRYFSVFGPRQRPDMAFARFARAAIGGEPITVLGDGRQTRDFTYVADVVAATRAAGRVEGIGGRVYNIGGGSPVALLDAVELLGCIAGRSLRVERAPAQTGEVRDTLADIRRARAELGYAPSTTLQEGLQAQFEWMAATHSEAVASPAPDMR